MARWPVGVLLVIFVTAPASPTFALKFGDSFKSYPALKIGEWGLEQKAQFFNGCFWLFSFKSYPATLLCPGRGGRGRGWSLGIAQGYMLAKGRGLIRKALKKYSCNFSWLPSLVSIEMKFSYSTRTKRGSKHQEWSLRHSFKDTQETGKWECSRLWGQVPGEVAPGGSWWLLVKWLPPSGPSATWWLCHNLNPRCLIMLQWRPNWSQYEFE